MEPTVTIELKQLDDLKYQLRVKEERIKELELQKDVRLTVDVTMYNLKGRDYKDSHVSVYGHLQHLIDKPEITWQIINNKVKDVLIEYINESKEITFYKTCPKWIRELVIQFL